MKKILLLLVLAVLFLGSCKKDKIPPVDDIGVTPEQARDTLWYIMKSFYFWYDLMPAVDRLN
jgi:hypothetical protein